MTPEEKEAETQDAMVSLENLRENKATAQHSVPMAAFQDTRVTLSSIHREVCTDPTRGRFVADPAFSSRPCMSEQELK